MAKEMAAEINGLEMLENVNCEGWNWRDCKGHWPFWPFFRWMGNLVYEVKEDGIAFFFIFWIFVVNFGFDSAISLILMIN